MLVTAEATLAYLHADLEQYEIALREYQLLITKESLIYGKEHPHTLETMCRLGEIYGVMCQPGAGIPLVAEAIEIGQRTNIPSDRLSAYEGLLKALYSQEASLSTKNDLDDVPSQEGPIVADNKPKNQTKRRIWPKFRRQIAGSSS